MSARRQATAMRRRAAVSMLLCWSLVSMTAAAYAATERLLVGTCNGQTITKLGEPGGTMVGTPGDDVFITRGAVRVDTGAGNDSICVTGRGAVIVNAGPGDDFVGARKHIGRSVVSLGFGDDLFLGGSGDDRVWSQEASNQNSSFDRDEIYTGDGDDYVISGSLTAANEDRVNLGPGDDVLVTYGYIGSASLDGGPGANTYQPLVISGTSGEWVFDNVAGRATLGGVKRLVWRAFQRFDLLGLDGPKVRFVGSRANERVTAGGTCRVVLRGRAGDDRLSVGADGCNSSTAGDALLLGGPGDDEMSGASGDDVLRGGKGRDRADGGLGADVCFAEVKISC